MASQPLRLVVLGSGWGGYPLCRSLSRSQSMRPTLISPRNHFLFTPLLPSTTVGTLEFRCVQEPVRNLPLARYVQASATDIDLDAKRVICRPLDDPDSSFDVPYDKLVIATGMRSNTFGVQGLEQSNYVYFLKQLDEARAIRKRLVSCFERASRIDLSEKERRDAITFVIVGGGPTSVEFAAELTDFLKTDGPRLFSQEIVDAVQIHLVEAGPKILGTFEPSLASYTAELLSKRKVHIRTGTGVKVVNGPGKAVLTDGSRLGFGLMVWSTGLAPLSFIEDLNIQKVGGRILVDSNLEVLGRPDVFALGDCAAIEGNVLPPLAQVAECQAKYLASRLMGGEQKPFEYNHKGSMVHIGNWGAIVDTTKRGKLTSPADSPDKSLQIRMVPSIMKGLPAFLTWRGSYWHMTSSKPNKMLIPFYWMKSLVFGRDIATF